MGSRQVRQGKVFRLWDRHEQVSQSSAIAHISEYGWANYPTAYGRAMNIARQLGNQYDKVLSEVDVIIMPTLSQPARRHIRKDAGPLEWASHARES